PGNVVVLSGRNRDKIAYLEAAVGAGLNVLADKPWVIRAEDQPRLRAVLDAAEARGLVAYDIMTERYEITSILQRELVNDAETFASPLPGSADEPGIFMESCTLLAGRVSHAGNSTSTRSGTGLRRLFRFQCRVNPSTSSASSGRRAGWAKCSPPCSSP